MKIIKFSDEIYHLCYFIIKEDREMVGQERLRGTRTEMILKTKSGDFDYTDEIAGWAFEALTDEPLVLIPYPSTDKDKSPENQLPFMIVKKLCQKNDKWIDGSKLLYRKYSLPKNTRDELQQLKSLALSNPEKIKGAKVFLIDDVVTTGSSLNAGISILKTAQPSSIIGLAVARKVYIKDVLIGGTY